MSSRSTRSRTTPSTPGTSGAFGTPGPRRASGVGTAGAGSSGAGAGTILETRISCLIKLGRTVFVTSHLSTTNVFSRTTPYARQNADLTDKDQMASLLQHELRIAYRIEVDSTRTDPHGVPVAGESETPFALQYLNENVTDIPAGGRSKEVLFRLIRARSKRSEIESVILAVHPQVQFMDVDALQSARNVFGSEYVRNYIISPDFEFLIDSEFVAEVAVSTVISSPGKLQIPKPELWYGVYHKDNPSKLTYADWQRSVEKVLEYSREPEEQAYIFVTRLLVGDAYSQVKEFEERTDPADKTWRNLLKYLAPLNVKIDVEEQAISNLKRTVMKDPTSIPNYYAFRSSFENNRIKGNVSDDFTLRSHWIQNVTKDLREKILDGSEVPTDIQKTECLDKSGVPYTYPKLLTHTDDCMKRIQQFFRIDQEASSRENLQTPDGKRKRTDQHSSDGKKSLKMSDADADGDKTSTKIRSKGERVKAGVGKNGTFKDGTPKTCNGCNSPDHLLDACPRGNQASNRSQQAGSSGKGRGNPSAGTQGTKGGKTISKRQQKSMRKMVATLKASGTSSTPQQNPASQAVSTDPSSNPSTQSSGQGNDQASATRAQVADQLASLCARILN